MLSPVEGVPHYRVVIVGAGFSGIGAAIRLRQAGLQDFIVLERASEVGGTWRDNIYPGCECDVPSNLYSFSFDPKPDWSRTFSPQSEIWDYLRGCVKRHGLEAHLRLDSPVTQLVWEDEHERWHLTTANGQLTAQVVVSATGALAAPARPRLPGLASFTGRAFHSARWDTSCELRDARVAIVGTGASAIQIVPRLQPLARELHVYQRTPPWILPRSDRAMTRFEHAAYRTVPHSQRAVRESIYWARELTVLGFRHPRLAKLGERIARRQLEHQIGDRALRKALRPHYRLGCKRILFSNDYYPALAQPNVTLIPHEVSDVTPTGIVAADGIERPVDVIVFATGFNVTNAPGTRRIRGQHGVTLAESWNGSPAAYNGTTIAGFPNLLMLLGPHTGLGHTSVLVMIEAQITYLLDYLHKLEQHNLASLAPHPGAQAEFVEWVHRRAHGTVWQSGGCDSWYLDSTGHSVLWPDFSWRFRQRLRRVDLEHYITRPSPAAA